MHRLFGLFFFISGFSALLFETVWFRQAGLMLGNSVWASSITVSSFMAGLAIGSAASFRWAERIRKPLRGYAVAELVVAASGVGLIWLFPRLTHWLVPVFRAVSGDGFWIDVIRLSIAFLLLLIPTAAMGCSLPLLARGLARFESNFARLLGLLYGANTLGACLGALIGETIGISAFGVFGTGMCAAVAASSASLLAFTVAGRLEPDSGDAKPAPAEVIPLRAIPARLTAAAFLAGAALLALEVVWLRFLVLFVHEGTLAFATVLAIVLLGIAVGGFVAASWSRVQPEAYKYSFYIFLCAAPAVVFGYIWFDDGNGVFSNATIVPISNVWSIASLALRLAFPTCVLSGMLFTFLGRALQAKIESEASSSAILGWANTIGAMVGGLVAGFVLLPHFGMEMSLFILSVVYLFTAMLVYAELAFKAKRLAILVGLAVAGFLAVFPFGLMTNHYLPLVVRPYVADGSRTVALQEGLTETAIYVQRDLWDEPYEFRLLTNGYSMSSSRFESQRYMSMFVTLPIALRPESTDALLISYGLGITAKSLVEQPLLETIDIVDISRDVLELNREVPLHRRDHPLDDPRVSVHIEDGRFFLLTTEKRFDVITAEPPPPKNSGIVYLYTREYFVLVYDRLKPGGLATIWLPAYQMELSESKAITAAFCEAFEDCSLWTGAGTEWMLVGSRELAKGPSATGFSAQWKHEATARRVHQIGLDGPASLGALFLADAEFLDEWTEGTEPLRDNYPHAIHARLDYSQAEIERFRDAYDAVQDPADSKARFVRSDLIKAWLPEDIRQASLEEYDFRAPIQARFERDPLDYGALYRLLELSEQRSGVVVALNADWEEIAVAERARARGIQSPRIDFLFAVNALASRDYEKASASLARASAKDEASAELMRLQLMVEVLANHPDRMAELAIQLESSENERDEGFWSWYAEVAASERLSSSELEE